MSQLQKLLDEKYPLYEGMDMTLRTIHTIARETYTEGYKAGALDQVFELHELLHYCWCAGREWGRGTSGLNFNDFLDRLTKPKTNE